MRTSASRHIRLRGNYRNMEEKLIRIVAAFVSVISLVSVFALYHFPQLRLWAEETAAFREQKSLEEDEQMTRLEILDYNMENIVEKGEGEVFSQQLRLEIPEGVKSEEVTLENNYLTQMFTITIPQADEYYLYDYPMVGRSDNIADMTYKSGEGEGVVEIQFGEVFEVESTYDGQYLYLDFLTPRELYDKVIVIDAGHGGDSSGTIKQGISEKDLDLAIALKLKEVFEEDKESKVGLYFTRTDDSNPSAEQRVSLANILQADLFISIHNNATESGRFSSISGTSVLYDGHDESLGAKHFAEICLDELTKALGSINKGLAEENETYILSEAKVPAALIEVGFMTNQQELANLNSAEYQRQAAVGIYQAIMRAFDEGY